MWFSHHDICQQTQKSVNLAALIFEASNTKNHTVNTHRRTMLPYIAAVKAACRHVLAFKCCSFYISILHLFCFPQPLIQAIGSEDERLQEAAAGCVRNIRLMVKAYMEEKLFK